MDRSPFEGGVCLRLVKIDPEFANFPNFGPNARTKPEPQPDASLSVSLPLAAAAADTDCRPPDSAGASKHPHSFQ